MSGAEPDKVFAGAIPKFYDQYLVPLIFEPYADDLARRLASRPCSRVLEIAAGTGVVTRRLASLLPAPVSIVATDLNRPMLDFAAEVGTSRPVEWREADAMQLPFDDGSFDAVVMSFGMLHLARPEAAIAEAHRVLAAGGRYAFTVWGRPDEAIGFGVVLRAIETHGTTNVGLPEGPPFFRFSEPGACVSALSEAGFERPRVQRLPLIWRLPSADALFQAALCGAVRTSAALRAQTPEGWWRSGAPSTIRCSSMPTVRRSRCRCASCWRRRASREAAAKRGAPLTVVDGTIVRRVEPPFVSRRRNRAVSSPRRAGPASAPTLSDVSVHAGRCIWRSRG